MSKKNSKKSSEINYKVVVLSLIGLLCLALTFFVHWLFIIGCAIVIWINQKELMGK